MTVTTTGLTKAAGAAAAVAGALFIGIQINHPPPGRDLDPDHRVVVRDTAQGADGRAGPRRHHRHVPQPGPPQRSPRAGRLPRAQRRLPAHPGHGLRRRVHPPGDRRGQPGVRQRRHRRDQRPRLQRRHRRDEVTVNRLQGFAYLAGGLLFGIALFRAGVLARWAAVLLAVGGVVTVALAVLPDAFYRLLAYPNGIAMIGLGVSLWRSQRTTVRRRDQHVDAPTSPRSDEHPGAELAGAGRRWSRSARSRWRPGPCG